MEEKERVMIKMYLALTEKEAKVIRCMGMTVIQFKKIVYKFSTCISKMVDAFKKVIEIMSEVGNKIRIAFEEKRNAFNLRESKRYKIVKFFSKLGYDKRKMWVSTRRTWLARSDC